MLKNSDIANLLAAESETAQQPLQKAYRRAARRAFLWPEEAHKLLQSNRSLTEFSGVGPFLEKRIWRWIDSPPKLPDVPATRSGFISIPEAQAALAKKPEWLSGIRGDLQMHSEWSDGTGSIREMAEAAMERRYEYVAITDHSKGLKIAGGIDEKQLEQQAEEIDEVNRSMRHSGKNFRVLRSIELNLSPRGAGDMDETALNKLDVVLGCFHSSLRKTEDQTERYVAALRNPTIQILGHPRGRIYNYRLGLLADWSRVFGTAAELDKAVEIDGYPDRQDLSPDLIVLARKAGCRISLGTDSHGPSQLPFMQLAVASAMRAGIKRERILNFMARDEFLNWVKKVRETAGAN
ncbi:MAG TPA: PHP domain-containing protein [Candidatus Acidoferrales bacterium]|jgi:histidinol phosphatase-like PHP family hydrolase|nr:PHP domain-containing protein [Candidatus Acidoferrales bacterium]